MYLGDGGKNIRKQNNIYKNLWDPYQIHPRLSLLGPKFTLLIKNKNWGLRLRLRWEILGMRKKTINWRRLRERGVVD